MENRFILLRSQVRSNRRARRELIVFLETVLVFLDAGFELGFSWNAAAGLSAFPAKDFPSEAFQERLSHWASDYPDPEARAWFAALLELYRGGGPLIPFFTAWVAHWREGLMRQMEGHARTLPLRLNLLLLIFCLPPVFFLLFTPLLRGF